MALDEEASTSKTAGATVAPSTASLWISSGSHVI